jgi:hypothetical protein
MATPDDDAREKRRDRWDVMNTGLKTLLIAHAAGLVTCLSLVKDYKDKAELKPVAALLIDLFGYGLMAGIGATVFLLVIRDDYLDGIARNTFTNRFMNRVEEWGCRLFSMVSVFLLLYAIHTLTVRANVLLP